MNFAHGAETVTNEIVTTLLHSISPFADVDDEYDHFLFPEYAMIQALLEKYWDASYIHYGEDAPDFPLCYDYAILCAGKVREACIRERMKSRIAFGTLRYTRTTIDPKTGEHDRHAICFVPVNNYQVKYFEPQLADVRWMDQPEELLSLDNFDI